MSDLHVEAGTTGVAPPAAAWRQPGLAAGQVIAHNAHREPLRVGGAALFLSPAHLSTLETLIASLLGGEKLVALTGPAGVGKTRLVEAAMPMLCERSRRVIRIDNLGGAPLSLDRLLGGILGTPDPAFLSEDDAARACKALLLEPDGKCATIVVIDNAQTLQADALRMLAMVTNQAGQTGHAVQILFVGRSAFFDTLRDDAPGGLPSRIATRLTMEPYSEQDARGFFERRLGLPSGDARATPLVLSDKALRAILQRGDGLPGRIADSLDAALAEVRRRGRRRRVSARLVRRTLDAPTTAASRSSARRLAMARLAAVLGFAVLLVGGWLGVSRLTGRPVSDQSTPLAGADSATVSRAAGAPNAGPVLSEQAGANERLVSPAVSRPTGFASDKTADVRVPALQPAAVAVVVMPVQAAETQGPPLDEPVRTSLRQRGDAMMAVGDVSAARLLYERAAQAGSGEAAADAGKTYDPSVLFLIGAVGIQPDRSAAARWYRRAIALGDQNAGIWLAGLGTPVP